MDSVYDYIEETHLRITSSVALLIGIHGDLPRDSDQLDALWGVAEYLKFIAQDMVKRVEAHYCEK